MVGKYNGLSDAYLSVIKALQHACIKCKSRLKVGDAFLLAHGGCNRSSAAAPCRGTLRKLLKPRLCKGYRW